MDKKSNVLHIEFTPENELVLNIDVQNITSFTALINSLMSGDIDEAIFAKIEMELMTNGMNEELEHIKALKEKMNNTFQKLLDKITDVGNQSIMSPSQYR